MWLRVLMERLEGNRQLDLMDVPPGRGAFENGIPQAFRVRYLVVGIRRKSSSSCVFGSCGKSIGLSIRLQHLDMMAWEAQVETSLCQTLLYVILTVLLTSMNHGATYICACLREPGCTMFREAEKEDPVKSRETSH